MSRLIVKGLPASMTEDYLRSIFSEIDGTVTDCRLKYTKTGKFRRFAFVGFAAEKEAQTAVGVLHQTFLGASRIQVEICQPFGDETKPRAWSKYSKDSSAYQRMNCEKNNQNDKSTIISQTTNEKTFNPNEQAKFDEFLEVQGKEDLFKDRKEKSDISTKDPEEFLLQNVSGDLGLQLLIRGLPPNVKRKSIKEWLAPIRIKALQISQTKLESAAVLIFDRKSDLRRALLRNGQFLGGFEISISKMKSLNEPESSPNTCEKSTNKITDTGRLFLRNLAYSCTEDSLRTLLDSFGPIADISLPIDRQSGRIKGFAVISFVLPEHAIAAYANLDGTVFQGRMLHILPGEEKREQIASADSSLRSSFQRAKAVKLRANSSQTHSWNSLFLSANSIADILTERLDVDKAELLSGEGDKSAGIRIALGETALVRETRQFLITHGVKLDAFSQDCKRSDRVIIVKNLPIGVGDDELRRAFGKYGQVLRLVRPTGCGITALLEMAHNQDAKSAFKALAYSRFRTAPLYLEWAPVDVFEKEATICENRDSHLEMDDRKAEEQEDTKMKSDEVEDESEPESTLFVKNLNFNTTNEELRSRFESIGPVKNTLVSTKRDPSNQLKQLSMGFGFVQYKSSGDAKTALKELQGVFLNGHCLELKLSHREEQNDDHLRRKSARDAPQEECTKILIRNIPFQTSIKELRQLFATFGELRSARLPKKLGSNSSHRGFAFVDFNTKSDAKRAMDSLLHSTHLYGRRLVLEWAKTEQSIQELRLKTAEQWQLGNDDKRIRGKNKRKIEHDLAIIDDD